MFSKLLICIFVIINLKLFTMLVQDSFINTEHINEAKSRLVGYWASDYTLCDTIADKHGYNRKEFIEAVYRTLN